MAKHNIHPTYCPGCSNESEALVDLGASDRVYLCSDCKNYYLGATWPGCCPACGSKPGRQRYVKTLDADARVPGDLCPDCQENQAKVDQAVREGGVRFQCTGCGQDGVFTGATPFAQKVREETKKPAPQDVFVQIKSCPQCPAIPGTEPDTDVQSFDDAEMDKWVGQEKEVVTVASALESAIEAAPKVPVEVLVDEILESK